MIEWAYYWLVGQRFLNAHLCSSQVYHFKKQRYNLAGAKCSICSTAQIFSWTISEIKPLRVCRPFNMTSFFLINSYPVSPWYVLLSVFLIIINNHDPNMCDLPSSCYRYVLMCKIRLNTNIAGYNLRYKCPVAFLTKLQCGVIKSIIEKNYVNN